MSQSAILDYKKAVKRLRDAETNGENQREMVGMLHKEGRLDRLVPYQPKYLQRAGIEEQEMEKLSLIHITGSKGKGSTAAMTESILRHHGYKTGLFATLCHYEVRERIRINGRPLSKEKFSQNFWAVYEKLQSSAVKGEPEEGDCMPGQFELLLVMAMRVFISERVDVVVLEVGKGGRFDKTNYIRQPVVCGITSLAMDHVENLAELLKSNGQAVITVSQEPEVLQTILDAAKVSKFSVYIARPMPNDYQNQYRFTLGLTGDVQLQNAGLALQLFRTFKAWKDGSSWRDELSQARPALKFEDIPVLDFDLLEPLTIRGLENCRRNGYKQVIYRGKMTYYIDGAHAEDGVKNLVSWFSDAADREKADLTGSVARVLIFGCAERKNLAGILPILKELGFAGAAFPINQMSEIEPLWQHSDQKILTNLDPETVKQEIKQSRILKKAWDKINLRCAHSDSQGHPLISSSDRSGKSSVSPDSPQVVSNKGYKASLSPDDHQVSSNLAGRSTLLIHGFPTSSNQSSKLTLPADGSQIQSYQNSRSTLSVDCSHVFECLLQATVWATQAMDPGVAACMTAPKDLLPPAPPAMREADHLQVLISGSSVLVGSVLSLLIPNMND